MDQVTFVKNFALCKEVGIAGKFIYDGMRDLNIIRNYVDTDNIFGFLYKISVGIERLQKIAYILLKNPTADEFERIEKEIITHSHVELQEKINFLVKAKLNKHQNSFLHLLTRFYNSSRYDRFNLSTSLHNEQDLLVEYLQERLNVKIETQGFFVSPMDNNIKKFLGKVIIGLTRLLYDIIQEEASKIGIYTHELNSESKSMKVFLATDGKNSLQDQIIDEQIALKEFLIFLMNTKETSEMFNFIKEIPPLDIDMGMLQEYLSEIIKSEIPQQLIDEIEYLYEDVDIKERLGLLECIGNPYCYISEDEDFEEYEPFEPNTTS